MKLIEQITHEDIIRSSHYRKRFHDRHQLLWDICRDKEQYEAGLDTEDHNYPDCSCGCRWFHSLEGLNGMDWGVCCNKESPRAGLLTFEHMGCSYWQEGG